MSSATAEFRFPDFTRFIRDIAASRLNGSNLLSWNSLRLRSMVLMIGIENKSYCVVNTGEDDVVDTGGAEVVVSKTASSLIVISVSAPAVIVT